MSASPVIIPSPNGGVDLFVIRPNHAVSHAHETTPAGILAPTWEDLGGVVYEISAAYDKTTGYLYLFAHGGPAGPAGQDQLYMRAKTTSWGDWIRMAPFDVA